MALTVDLIGLGLPPELAGLLGQSALTAVTAAGTTAATAALLSASETLITAAVGATGVIFPASASVTRLFFVRNAAASTASAVVYPPLGGNFNGGAANAGIAIIAGQSILAFRQSTNDWVLYQTDDSADGLAPISGQTVSPRTIAIGGLVPAVSTDFTDATPVATEVYIGEILIPVNMTVTGVAPFHGSVASGNMKVGLADSTGAIVATSASTAVVGTDSYQLIPFTAPYAALGPATYYVLGFYDNGTARYNAPPLGAFGASKQTGQTYATGFTTVTPPTTFTTNLAMIASLY